MKWENIPGYPSTVYRWHVNDDLFLVSWMPQGFDYAPLPPEARVWVYRGTEFVRNMRWVMTRFLKWESWDDYHFFVNNPVAYLAESILCG